MALIDSQSLVYQLRLKRKWLMETLLQAQVASVSTSNDRELEVLQEALDAALELLAVDQPPDWEYCGGCGDVIFLSNIDESLGYIGPWVTEDRNGDCTEINPATNHPNPHHPES